MKSTIFVVFFVFMASSSELWESWRAQLARDYVDETGKKADCGAIAIEFCEALHGEGQPPHYVILQSVGTTRADRADSILNPTPYPERTWWYHCVCTVDEVVYDPMLETPTDLRLYPEAAFGASALEIVEDILWLPNETE